jgi:hypothetical protein
VRLRRLLVLSTLRVDGSWAIASCESAINSEGNGFLLEELVFLLRVEATRVLIGWNSRERPVVFWKRCKPFE